MDTVALFEQISALEKELSRDLQPLRRIAEAVAAGGFGFREARAWRHMDYLGSSWNPSESRDVRLLFRVDADFACFVTFESNEAFGIEVDDDTLDDEEAEAYWTRTGCEETAIQAVLSQLEEYAACSATR